MRCCLGETYVTRSYGYCTRLRAALDPLVVVSDEDGLLRYSRTEQICGPTVGAEPRRSQVKRCCFTGRRACEGLLNPLTSPRILFTTNSNAFVVKNGAIYCDPAVIRVRHWLFFTVLSLTLYDNLLS